MKTCCRGKKTYDQNCNNNLLVKAITRCISKREKKKRRITLQSPSPNSTCPRPPLLRLCRRAMPRCPPLQHLCQAASGFPPWPHTPPSVPRNQLFLCRGQPPPFVFSACEHPHRIAGIPINTTSQKTTRSTQHSSSSSSRQPSSFTPLSTPTSSSHQHFSSSSSR